MESKILNIIKTNPNWRKYISDFNIKIKEENGFAIFNYGIGADFTNPIVREARGIIIDINRLRLVSWPFNKFCNVNEDAAQIDLENFDWKNFRVEDKIDGSIIKLSYYPNNPWQQNYNGWFWSTNSCMNANDAPVVGENRSYLDIIQEAINYKDIDYSSLNTRYTYIFELVSPQTQVVIHYPVTKLYHIGTRDLYTGKEQLVDIGIEHPIIYNIHALDDCIHAASMLNQNSSEVKKEGFVVVDENWNRVKIKAPEYLEFHYTWNNGNISKEKIIGMIMNDNIVDGHGHLWYETLIKYYEYKLKELEYEISRYIEYVRGLYAECDYNRKDVANTIRNDRYSAFGFTALNNDTTAEEMMKKSRISTLCKLIDDYKRRDIY